MDRYSISAILTCGTAGGFVFASVGSTEVIGRAGYAVREWLELSSNGVETDRIGSR